MKEKLLLGCRWLLDQFSTTPRRLWRLWRMPSHKPGEVCLGAFSLRFLDGPSTASVYESVVRDQCLAFDSDRTDPRILDCGANIGLVTLEMASRFPAARITAFEPDPNLHEALCDNVKRNVGDSPSIELVRAAVWTEAGEVSFHSEGADSGRVRSDIEQGTETKPDIIKVPAVRLRDYLCEPIDLLKIDIEGGEVDVLRDCASALGCVQRIVVEYHAFVDRPQEFDALIQILSDAGFRLHTKPVRGSQSPLLHRQVYDGMDFQIDIYAFRK